MSLLSGPTLSVKLAEPFVFVTAPNRGASARTQVGPALVRGLLVLKLPKATKITGIDVIFDGRATTDWPEGIGPRRIEVSEHIPLISLKTSFLDSASTDRRALSLGPGIRFDDYEAPENDEFLQQYPRSSGRRENPPGFETEAEASASRDQSSLQRASATLPAYDQRPFLNQTGTQSPFDETPPYSPRLPTDISLPQSPLAQSPYQEEGPFIYPSSTNTTSRAEVTSPTAMQDLGASRDRGRSFVRGNEESPVIVPTRHSYHEELEHPPDRYTDSAVLDPDGAGVDPDDHPMSVIPEDPDPAEHETTTQGHSIVDVRSTPNTRPASTASSLNHLELHRWHSSSSSIDHSGGEAPSPAFAATTSSLPIQSGAVLSPVPTRISRPTTGENSRQLSSRASSPSQPPTPSETPLPTATGTARDRRSMSPAVALANSRARRASAGPSGAAAGSTMGRGGSRDHSPSRERSGHTTSHRFSLSAVTHMLREVSQEVRDAVGGGSSRERRSRSRATERPSTTLSHSRAPSFIDDRPSPGASSTSGAFARGYGRGGLGSQERNSRRSRTRDHEQDRNEHSRARRRDVDDDDELVGRRGRDVTVNPIGDAYHSESASKVSTDGWKEFRKGTYTYPISFAIPPDLPPSLRCDFGSVSYRLKATVHRAGTFAPKLTSAVDVNLISCLSPDSTDDLDNVVVQRSWEDKLSYVVNIEGTAFPIGGTIPVNITVMPMEKISLYRVSLGVDEKVDYYAHGRKVARHEPVQHFEIISVRSEDKHQRLLPIISDSAAAALSSPLAPYARPSAEEAPDLVIPPSASTESLEHTSDVASHLLNPSGPWHFHFDVQIPDCHSGLHFTNKGPGARIVVLHRLKTVLRVSAGIHNTNPDTKERPKLFDIIIETPIHLLNCQCQSTWTHLPTYTQLPTPLASPLDGRSLSGMNNQDHHHHHQHAFQTPSYTRRNPPAPVPAIGPTRGSSYTRPQSQTGSHSHPNVLSFVPVHVGSVNMRSSSTDERNRAESSAAAAAAADVIQRSEQFARLVSGQESEAGEQPPAYTT